MNIRILIPLIFFILGFNAAAQKYQLRPVIVQILPFGGGTATSISNNEYTSADTSFSGIATHVNANKARYKSENIGLNFNVSVYAPVYKKFYVGFNYNTFNSNNCFNYLGESSVYDANRPGKSINADTSIHVGYNYSYQEKRTSMGVGIMYLPNNPMKKIPIIPYFKLGVNLNTIKFSDVVLEGVTSRRVDERDPITNDVTSTQYRDAVSKSITMKDVSTLSFHTTVGVNIKINEYIQYTLIDVNCSYYQFSNSNNIVQISLNTGVTLLIGKRK